MFIQAHIETAAEQGDSVKLSGMLQNWSCSEVIENSLEVFHIISS